MEKMNNSKEAIETLRRVSGQNPFIVRIVDVLMDVIIGGREDVQLSKYGSQGRGLEVVVVLKLLLLLVVVVVVRNINNEWSGANWLI